MRHSSLGPLWADSEEDGTSGRRLLIRFLVEVLKSLCVWLDWEGRGSTDVNARPGRTQNLRLHHGQEPPRNLGRDPVIKVTEAKLYKEKIKSDPTKIRKTSTQTPQGKSQSFVQIDNKRPITNRE